MFGRTISVFLAALSITTPVLAQVSQTNRTDVPVRTVMLFSSGVGYFEHAGSVRGDGSTELRFSSSQINDILKSLVLQDLDGGRVSNITYPSHDPVSKTLRSFQVDITANPSMGDLLNQLRGARVTVQVQGERMSGTILGVEPRRKPDGTNTPILNLLAGAMIRAVDLQTVASLTLDDQQLQDELTKALVALSQARDQDKKPVTINFSGSGDRRVRIGYVVETPVWKTSYRLLLDKKTSHMQGWAIVENQTESDWNNVALSLVSGRPISFRMDLYQPLYAPRQMIAQELFAGLTPQLYGAANDAKSASQPLDLRGDFAARGGGGGGRGAPASIVEQGVVGASAIITNQALAALPVTSAGDVLALQGGYMSVQSLASALQVGELFQYNIANVTLARQKSAMLPIIADSISMERVSIYNASVMARHPLNGVRLKNTTGKHLLQGPVTVVDDNSYAGDARIDNVPPGQERLLSYGVDLDVVVDNTKNTQTNAIFGGRIDRGLLTISRKLVSTREYLSENKSDREKMIVIEHPIRHGWKLMDSLKPRETTPALYRFQGAAAPKKSATLTVREEMVQYETVALLSTDITQLLTYSKTGEISSAVRDAIVRAVQLKQAVTETERRIAERTRQITEIGQEQARMRENMRTTGSTTQYYQRLMAKLNEQESTIERLQTERDAFSAQRDAQRKAFDDYVSTLTVS